MEKASKVRRATKKRFLLVMSMMVSFVLSFFPRDVLDEILNLIESVSEDFPSYSYRMKIHLSIKEIMTNILRRPGSSVG